MADSGNIPLQDLFSLEEGIVFRETYQAGTLHGTDKWIDAILIIERQAPPSRKSHQNIYFDPSRSSYFRVPFHLFLRDAGTGAPVMEAPKRGPKASQEKDFASELRYPRPAEGEKSQFTNYFSQRGLECFLSKSGIDIQLPEQYSDVSEQLAYKYKDLDGMRRSLLKIPGRNPSVVADARGLRGRMDSLRAALAQEKAEYDAVVLRHALRYAGAQWIGEVKRAVGQFVSEKGGRHEIGGDGGPGTLVNLIHVATLPKNVLMPAYDALSHRVAGSYGTGKRQ